MDFWIKSKQVHIGEQNIVEADPKSDTEDIRSRFSAENFKLEDSYDAYAKEHYPELNDLKSKCVYDVQPMGTLDEQIERSPKDEYTQEERDYLKDIREQVDAPTTDTIMQKVIGVDTGNIEKDLQNYLNPVDRNTGIETDAQVYGFVAKANDAAPYSTTPQECYDNLRLDYTETPYVDSNQSVYAIRFTDGENYTIPYGEQFGGETTLPAPNAENGYISCAKYTIPEYTVDLIPAADGSTKGAIVTDGEIYRINPDGTEEAVAYYDADEKTFKLYKEENF